MATTVPQPAHLYGSSNSSALTCDVLLLCSDQELGGVIADELTRVDPSLVCRMTAPGKLTSADVRPENAVIYIPSLRRDAPMLPDLVEAESVCRLVSGSALSVFILVSSAAIYGANFRNPGQLQEVSPLPKGKSSSALQWLALERIAQRHWDLARNLTILRCATVLSRGCCANLLARELAAGVGVTAAGHDPSIQLLSSKDLGQATACLLDSGATGIFNAAPDEPIPLKQAFRRIRAHRLALPRTLLLSLYGPRRRGFADQLDYKRYSWTVSNESLAKRGFKPKKSSLQALLEFRDKSKLARDPILDAELIKFDKFGMDKGYIDFYGRTLFRFLCDYYWRIEHQGMKHVPQQGRAVLVGMHRGLMPWDGVMALHLLVQNIRRYPRFLIHPGLLKFPFLTNFMTKLGGIVASQANADRVLGDDELLGIFPEGIQGAFTPYRGAYQLKEFGRDAFVKIALRNRAPIVPFVTVGSAEIFPILGRIKSRSWTRYSEWPSLPITPTFPLLPVPLPSKWHTKFLPPIHIEEEYPPEAERNPSIVKAISLDVRNRMQTAVNEMLVRRRSIFFGSIFSSEASE
jgi:1-acyl-sn-glycerol-3-phosphate acyltransferase